MNDVAAQGGDGNSAGGAAVGGDGGNGGVIGALGGGQGETIDDAGGGGGGVGRIRVNQSGLGILSGVVTPPASTGSLRVRIPPLTQ